MASHELNKYSEGTYGIFPKVALDFYLQNLRTKYFPDVAKGMFIIRYLHDLMKPEEIDEYQFMEHCINFLASQNLNALQEHAVIVATKKFITMLTTGRNINLSYHYKETFLPFFTMLEGEALARKWQNEAVEKDVKEDVHQVIKQQLLRLSEEINGLPTEKKAKVLATLVRTLAQYERLTAPPKPGKTTKTKPTPKTETIEAQPATENQSQQPAPAFPAPPEHCRHLNLPPYERTRTGETTPLPNPDDRAA